ncbi:MAG: DJ-1/PfpI family protein [Tissierellia bacterium]|nr:DJ-1/PfpI family protein [Tissierellia bacterium]
MTKVYTLLKNGFEEIEALTIVDYLRRADIDVTTVSVEDTLEVQGGHNIKVLADMMLDDLKVENIDLIFVPGGMPAAEDLSNDSRVTELISSVDKNGRVVASICAGPMVLEKAGVLKGKSATSYPGFDTKLESLDNYLEDLVVVDENIITSRGPSTAVYLALKLIELLKGSEKKDEIKKNILLDKVEAQIKTK